MIWGSGTFRSVFAFGAEKLFGSGQMTGSSCTRGAVSRALLTRPSGGGVVEKVPRTAIRVASSRPQLTEELPVGRRGTGTSGVGRRPLYEE